MEPTLVEGQTVLVCPRRPARPGDVVVVELPDGVRAIKRVASLSGGLDVRGDNPARSTDSRQLGLLAPSSVRGVVVCTFP